MKINATTVDDYDEKGLYGGRLRGLCVYDSPIEDPARVAAFISDIFPYVKLTSILFVPCNNIEKKFKRKWNEVERIIAAAQSQEANQQR